MNQIDIALQRLHNQQISASQFQTPAEIVNWLGAVQAQDFAGAKWALGLRLSGSTESVIEQAYTEGSILRTHVMRPTWHFVTPVDIRWMLELTAPRVTKLMSHYYRKMELDEAVFQRCKQIMTAALEGGHHLTREELTALFEQQGIKTSELRATFIIMWAELDALICSGARRGKQHTYALLDERAPQAKYMPREEAVIDLTQRYFTSHGPATIQDFVWWSGLLTADAKAGLDALKSQLECIVIDNQTYWFMPTTSITAPSSPNVYMLPDFDEYTVSYTDRSAISMGWPQELLNARDTNILNYVIVVDTQVVGNWKRTLKKDRVLVELKPYAPLSDTQLQAVHIAVRQYGEFLGLAVEISYDGVTTAGSDSRLSASASANSIPVR